MTSLHFLAICICIGINAILYILAGLFIVWFESVKIHKPKNFKRIYNWGWMAWQYVLEDMKK